MKNSLANIMAHQLISQQVDIYKYPNIDTLHQAKPNTQLTIGDLHGNCIKFLYFLIKHGVITDINKEDYQQFINVYTAPTLELTGELIHDFNIRMNKINCPNQTTIRLIGDELADRGSNDYFTLKLLEKLASQKTVKIEILLSNHSVELLEAYERDMDFVFSRMPNQFVRSMLNMQTLIEKDLINRNNIETLIKKDYAPLLKALSYTLNQDNSGISIFSHAAIDLQVIQNLATQFDVAYNDSTAPALAQTIDTINAAFQEYVRNKQIHTLYPEQMNFDNNHPVIMLIWNRNYNVLKRPTHSQAGYKIDYIHGHDPDDTERENIINLDNMLGKSDILNVGEYTVLYSTDVI